MDLVVVYLTDVAKHIIVPEKYIYGLDLKQLKNRGKNMSRNHLVYWSDNCIEGELYPEPNENAPKSQTFPAGNGAWYFGRTIHFTDDFEDALMVKEHRRNRVPPVYNAARLSERPLPVLDLMNEHDDSEADEGEIEAGSDASNEENISDMIDPLHQFSLHDEADDGDNILIEQNNVVVGDSTPNSDDNVNGAFVEQNNVVVGDSTPNSDDNINDASSSQNTPTVCKQEPIFDPLGDDESQAIGGILNDSYEQCDSDGDVFVEKSAQIPKPCLNVNPYETKKNDILSGNFPFATDKTSGDRAYILSKGIDFKQVNLQSRVVIGLTRYNLHGFRHSAVYDKKFIKILMISVVGLPEIRGNSMDPMKMDFIKDLFEIRSEGKRMNQFDEIVKVCQKEISSGNYA